jgi:Phage capsid protein
MPDLTIDQFYTTQFDANWQHLVQQDQGRLFSRVRQEQVKGKRKLINFIGKAKARLITTRSGKTIPSNTPLAKRKLSLRPYDEVYHEDEWDQELLGEVTSPRSAIIQAHANAFQRVYDEMVIEAALGTVYIGEDGNEPVDLPNSQKVPINYIYGSTGSNSGLTLAKMIRAKSLLGKAEAFGQNKTGLMGETLFLVVSQAQLDDLLVNVDQVSNGRYSDVKALVAGEINTFMGFEIIRTQLLPIDLATRVRTCVAFVSSGVAFSANDRSVKITVRDDLNETLQIRTKGRHGATRTEEEKVVAIFCDESP